MDSKISITSTSRSSIHLMLLRMRVAHASCHRVVIDVSYDIHIYKYIIHERTLATYNHVHLNRVRLACPRATFVYTTLYRAIFSLPKTTGY